MEYGLSQMHQRGPDDQQLVQVGEAALGICRLSITDVERGPQPLSSMDATLTMVFNGAIYNHQSLRDSLSFPLQTGNDGEVIHALYQQRGLQFADVLQGMYAILLYDRATDQLIAARDPLGIKPLYWTQVDGVTYFASTVSAFPAALQAQVRDFPAGMVWTSQGLFQPIRPIYSVPQAGLLPLLRHAVRQRIPTEVPWGCMLSGGVDSSALALLAAECTMRPVEAFSLGNADSPDGRAAQALAEAKGFRLHQVHIDPAQVPEAIETVIQAVNTYDPFSILSGIGTYLLCRYAQQQGIKVLLSGEGADELFGGYHEFQPFLAELDYHLGHHQNNLWRTECLRLDRCAMAASVEVRVPYLDLRVVQYARQLPVHEKMRVQEGLLSTKIHLRDAVSGLLPNTIAHREKVPFFKGAGLHTLVDDLVHREISDAVFEQTVREFPHYRLASKRAVYFFLIWRRQYPQLASSHQDLLDRGLSRELIFGATQL